MTAAARPRALAPSYLPWRIARRYLSSRRKGRFLSLNTIISIGGVTVGVAALVVVLGVMNGLQDDLREKILVGNPHLRILTFGGGLRIDNWEKAIEIVRRDPEVLAAAPEVLTVSVLTAGKDYAEPVNILGFEPDTGSVAVTSLPQTIVRGDLRFQVTNPNADGAVLLGQRLAERLGVQTGELASPLQTAGGVVDRGPGRGTPPAQRGEHEDDHDWGGNHEHLVDSTAMGHQELLQHALSDAGAAAAEDRRGQRQRGISQSTNSA